MTNIMIKANGAYLTFPANKEQEVTELMSALTLNFETFKVGKMPLEALPAEIQEEVKSILKAYNEANVVYENGRFGASASYGIKANYNYDHFVCGYYKAEEIYTKEERKKNFIDVFGYAPRNPRFFE